MKWRHQENQGLMDKYKITHLLIIIHLEIFQAVVLAAIITREETKMIQTEIIKLVN